LFWPSTGPEIIRLSDAVPLASTATDVTDRELIYKVDPGWPQLPPGRPEPTGLQRRIGYQHGDIAVASGGDVYVSVQNMWRVSVVLDGRKVDADVPLPAEYGDPYAGVQVYAPDGRYLRNVPRAPTDLHGFIIRQEAGDEFIYGSRVAETNAPPDQTKADWYSQAVVKMTLDGKIALAIPASAVPDRFKVHRPDGAAYLRLTDVAVGPNGDIYVSDGYSSDFVHRFDRNGKYVMSFGGKKDPYNFSTLHKLALDSRFSPPRLIATDRANNRIVWLSLDGDFLGVVAKDLLLPSAIAVWNDYAMVAELMGQITILDKAGKVVAKFGTDTVPDEQGNRLLEPARWRPGIVTAPHGIAVNKHGDVFVTELNSFGRVHRFNRE
jgi:hypothetical protein